MRVLVTGGAGFIGSHVVDALITSGHDPVVLDDLSSGQRGNLRRHITFINGDIGDPSIVDVIADLRPVAVIHTAAHVSVPGSMADPGHDRSVNLLGTEHVITGARRASAERLVYLSSGGGIYGETDEPATESSVPKPTSFYGVHKYAAERYVEMSGIGFAIARLANVYGPRQQSDLEGGVVAIFAERLATGQPITIYGTGEQRRDLVHVADVTEAILLMLDVTTSGIWNVGTGRTTNINALLALMEDAIAPATEVRYETARVGDVFDSSMSVEKIEKELGWRPKTRLAKGVRTLSHQ